MMNQPSMRVMSKAYMLAHAGECVKISDDGLSFEAVECGGSITVPSTAYASNAAALSALDAGIIYKTTATIHNTDDQPILSVTYNP